MKPVCVHLSPLWHPLEIPSTESWVYLACWMPRDRKSTRLNSSHLVISYAVFCLKKKTRTKNLLHRDIKRRPVAMLYRVAFIFVISLSTFCAALLQLYSGRRRTAYTHVRKHSVIL